MKSRMEKNRVKSVKCLVVLLMLTAFWIGMILGFSSQSGEESGGLSAFISKPITDVLSSMQGGLSAEEEAALYLQVDGTVRTAAHFTEFAVLGVFLALLANHFGMNMFWLPWGMGTLIAVADEWRQSFSPGRMSDPRDVLVDSLGVISGCILIYMVVKHWRKKYVHHS